MNRMRQFVHIGVMLGGIFVAGCETAWPPAIPGNQRFLQPVQPTRGSTSMVTPVFPGDLDHDGQVTLFDYIIFVHDYPSADLNADLTGDGFVDCLDFFALVDLLSAENPGLFDSDIYFPPCVTPGSDPGDTPGQHG